MATDQKPGGEDRADRTEFKITGVEMIERIVKESSGTGRASVPRNWVGSTVKIVRVV